MAASVNDFFTHVIADNEKWKILQTSRFLNEGKTAWLCQNSDGVLASFFATDLEFFMFTQRTR